MAIFLLTNALGGAEQILFNLTMHQVINRVYVFGNKQNNIWEEAGFEVEYFDNSFLKMISSIRKKKFHTIYSSHLMMNAMLGFLRSGGVLKTKHLVCRESTSVFTRYSGLKLLRYKLAYRFGYHKIDLLITQSDDMKATLIKNAPYLDKRIKIRTIPNLFRYPSSVSEIPPYDFKYIITAGRLIKEKGYDILIDSYNELINDYPQLKLVILGEGGKREELEQQIERLGLKDRVLLPGFVDDVYPYFKHAEMCVVSSHIEGFPNVLLQMMSQNNKVVSTLCAGGIENLQGVVTCETNNLESLKYTMIKALDSDSSINRVLFDKELESRSIESFVGIIEEYLNE